MSRPILRPQASKQHGQTLAEFAISLPLVLLLLFGILEFGRMFQSWVTLQNAARSAVRYAVTGQYNTQKYNMEWLIPCYKPNQYMTADVYKTPIIQNGLTTQRQINIWRPTDPNIKPPAIDYENFDLNNSDHVKKLISDPANSDRARHAYQAYKNAAGQTIVDRWEVFTPSNIDELKAENINNNKVQAVALNPDESLYTTWYGRDGDDDCVPNDDTDQYRKDMLRLASIYDEARRGAAGLALDDSLTGSGSLPEFKNFLYTYWAQPSISQTREGWFNVMICSARARMYPNTQTEIVNNPDDSKSTNPLTIANATGRFHTFRGPGDPPSGTAAQEDYVGGGCFLKEAPLASNTVMSNNYNMPWADAGSSGDRVVIIITYNHPLITPLGLARFVRMQSSRSAVNEAFKIVNAERATGGGGAGSGDIFATNTPAPSATPKPPDPTDPPPPTITLTPQPTIPPTKVPFDCKKLLATDAEFSGTSTIYVRLQNDNVEDTEYLRSDIAWNSNRMLTSSPDAFAGFVSIENQVNWTGYQDKANKSMVSTEAPTQGDSFLTDEPAPKNDVYSPGVYVTVPTNGSSRWQLTFIGLTKPLYQTMDLWELGSTRIYLRNPDGGECAIALTGPAVLTPTPTPVGQVPTATFTPDCAGLKYSVAFKEFMPNGDVHLQVTSLSQTQVGYFVGFTIQWAGAKSIIGTSLKFLRLTVNGRNANDYASPTNPNGAGQVVWESSAAATGGSTTPPTTSAQGQAEWQQSFVFPAGRTTDVYLDFTGVGADSLAERGVSPAAFNNSTLRISCNPNGTGGNGSGGNAQGDITFANQNTPTPAGPPTNTITPAPTLPPTKTFTPGPTSTKTNTPLPTTKAPNTAIPNTPTNTPKPPTATPNRGSCTDGC